MKEIAMNLFCDFVISKIESLNVKYNLNNKMPKILPWTTINKGKNIVMRSVHNNDENSRIVAFIMVNMHAMK